MNCIVIKYEIIFQTTQNLHCRQKSHKSDLRFWAKNQRENYKSALTIIFFPSGIPHRIYVHIILQLWLFLRHISCYSNELTAINEDKQHIYGRKKGDKMFGSHFNLTVKTRKDIEIHSTHKLEKTIHKWKPIYLNESFNISSEDQRAGIISIITSEIGFM